MKEIKDTASLCMHVYVSVLNLSNLSHNKLHENSSRERYLTVLQALVVPS